MSSDSDLIKLYSRRILALAAEIPYRGRLEDPQASVRKRAPLCGSTVTMPTSSIPHTATPTAMPSCTLKTPT